MKNKTEICVPIRNEEELQQAKDMLEKNGEKIDKDLFYLSESTYLNYLQGDDLGWFLSRMSRKDNETEIPLSELESVLKGGRVEKQSSIDWLVKELYRKFGENYELTNIVKQAKQMHREEIEQAFEKGFEDVDPKRYYNDTFGN